MVAYSFKRRFVTPIKVGLGQIEHIPGTEFVPKRQTIRSAAGKKRHARPGEMVQLYYGLRTKHCFSIGVARCTDVAPIKIMVTPMNGLLIETDRIIGSRESEQFSKDDGFASLDDMDKFWREEHGEGLFVGVLIKWEPV